MPLTRYERLISDGFDTVDYAVEKIREAKADTVRKMQERLKKETECVGELTTDNILAEMYSVVREDVIDTVAKEMLEDNT